MKYLLGVLLLVGVAWGQSTMPDAPTASEMTELLNKASDKLDQSERAIKSAQPYVDPTLIKTQLDVVRDGREIIKTMNDKGRSTYGLVILIASLDDLALNTSKSADRILGHQMEAVGTGHSMDAGAFSAATGLQSAEQACTDISELILHATLRYIGTEERLLAHLIQQSDGAANAAAPASPQPVSH